MSKVRERFYRECASNAGMAVPDGEAYDKASFPHFSVFTTVQRARPQATKKQIRHNAYIVAGIPPDQITRLSLPELMLVGIDLPPNRKK